MTDPGASAAYDGIFRARRNRHYIGIHRRPHRHLPSGEADVNYKKIYVQAPKRRALCSCVPLLMASPTGSPHLTTPSFSPHEQGLDGGHGTSAAAHDTDPEVVRSVSLRVIIGLEKGLFTEGQHKA